MNQPHLDIDHEHERIDNALDGTPKEPSASDTAMAQLQESIRNQIVAISKGEITSKTMAQLQRFCASVGQALITLEKPDALVRRRFGNGYPMLGMMSNNPYGDGGEYVDDGALATAPAPETYGANTSRGLIESAAKIGKDLVTAQAEAQRAARRPSMVEMISALTLAKKQKLSKSVIKALEKQIEDAASEPLTSTPVNVNALPAAIPPPPLKKSKTGV